MQFHVRLIDGPGTQETRKSGSEAHWQYLDDNIDHMIGRGPTYKDDRSGFASTLFFLEFSDWQDVRRFLANEPHNMNGVYSDVYINRWENESGRMQRDFPRHSGQVNWFLRGYAKPAMHGRWLQLKSEHLEYMQAFDKNNTVVRGPLFDDEGAEWKGSASVISIANKEDVEELLHSDTFYKNGLYERCTIEEFKFGGRPGQVI